MVSYSLRRPVLDGSLHLKKADFVPTARPPLASGGPAAPWSMMATIAPWC